ncbi:MAG: hypothetical protein ACYTET_06300, partial [Planctomycetota bacterium]
MNRKMQRVTKDVLFVVIVTGLILNLCASCSDKTNEKQASQESIKKGELMDQVIHFQYAIYYLSSPTKDPLA